MKLAGLHSESEVRQALRRMGYKEMVEQCVHLFNALDRAELSRSEWQSIAITARVERNKANAKLAKIRRIVNE